MRAVTNAMRLHWTAALALALLANAAWAMKEGRTAAGVRYLTGGVTQGELADINLKRPLHNLSVLTAARPSGAHLSDVRLAIVAVPAGSAKGGGAAPLLDVVMEGPWLLANLDPGTYDLTATLGEKVERMRITIVVGADRQVIFRIPTGDELSPDQKPAPK